MSFLDKARPVSQATSSQPSFLVKATPVEPEKSLGRKTAEVLAPSTTNLSDYVRASTRLKSGEVANIQKEREAVQAGITQMEQMLPSRPDLAQSIAESKQRIAEIDKDVAGVVSKADKTTGQKAGMALGTGLELGSLPELALLRLGKAFGVASTKKVLEVLPKNKVVQAITKATTVAPKTAQQDLAYKLAPLSEKAKIVAKETAKVLPESLAFGYGYDVSTGLQDKAEQPFAPGAGTVMGASIPVAIGNGRLVKNAMFKPTEKKIADIITRRESELYNIENNYSLLRKNMNFSKDANAASRRRIASTDILANAVDDTGTIRTTNPGGPVDQYREQVLHGSEAIVRKNLEREGAYTTPDIIRRKIEKVIGDSRLTMDEKETAFSGIDKILAGFQRQYPDGKIPLVAIQDEKVNAGALAYRNLDPAIKTRLKDLTRAYKEVLEESSNLNVKEMNDELAKYLKDISLLESLDGRKVKGGKLGKYFAQISGNLIGGATGSAIGGVPGAAIGTVIGGELASRIKGTALSRTLAGETGQVGVKSPILKEAQQKATSPRLQLPAPKFGRDYVQSNKSGNLNQRYADTAITSNSGNISKSVPLATDNASIQDMKLAEDFLNSQPNATIEADQIKAKELLSGLNAQLEALDSMDSMKALGKFVGKRGEFKGELNLNNGSGKFGREGDTILREAVPGSQGKSAEELAGKYSSWASSKQAIKENMDSLKKFLRQSPRGFVDLNADVFPKKTATPAYKETGDLTTKILKSLEGKSTVSKQFILDATNRGELKQVERDLIRKLVQDEPNTIDVTKFANKVKAELLPLERKAVGEGKNLSKYESISLPDDLRGNVKNYTENIYASPIKTSAGNVHFGGSKAGENYFGHTRIEDMADNSTRRVIEVQSDLYQKGNLEKELNTDYNAVKALTDAEQKEYTGLAIQMSTLKPGSAEYVPLKQKFEALKSKATGAKTIEMSKLQQYNDPTAHFRMIREEVKKAAEDGKTKLQFPTGETAMKIEGLDRLGMEETEALHRLEGFDIRSASVGDELFLNDFGEPDYKVLRPYSGDTNSGNTLLTHPENIKFEGTAEEYLNRLWEQSEETQKRMIKISGVKKDADGMYNDSDIIEGILDNVSAGIKDRKDPSITFNKIVNDILGEKRIVEVGENRVQTSSPYMYSDDIVFELSDTPQTLREVRDLYKDVQPEGKVDTNNPIYKFYNKEVRNYLNKFGGKEIVDDKGVSWIEIPIGKNSKGAVEAFGLLGAVGLGAAASGNKSASAMSTQDMPLLGSPQEDKQEAFMRPNEAYLRKPASTYSVRKNLSVSEDELKELAAVLFGEVGNRPLDKKLTELRAITNIALNRAEKEGKTLKEVLQSPNQFQAYLGKQYNSYKSGKASNSVLEKEKIKAVEAVIDEIRKGKLKNTVGDNLSYAHLKDDTLRLYKDWSEQKKDLKNIK